MKIKNIIKEERPRERLMRHGPETLSSAELLAIILGNGSKKENVLILANRILSEYNFNEISNLKITDLTRIFGIGKVKACKIISCFELGKRANSFSPEKKKVINSSKDVYRFFGASMENLKKENFKVIFLDSRKRIINEETIFIGSLNASIIHPREIFDLAIRYYSAGIILIHNHPSGEPSPSDEDIKITKQLVSCGKILDIEIVDHVIIGDKKFFSFVENRLI
ncbi:MAG: DNA repair protein RadC [Candidatus Pacearchaeota archaeon]|nr:DNA repair protein RadC [Candidatus Pacearchaeota archaeon]